MHAAIQINDVTVSRRKYVFDLSTPDGAKAAFYLSASDKFTFSVTDTKGETYPLEIPVGEKGIPLGVGMYLAVEVGVSSTASFLSVSVNGIDVGHRDLPFAIDLGSRDWKNVTVGADANKQNFGGFALATLMILTSTLNRDSREKLKKWFLVKYDLPGNPDTKKVIGNESQGQIDIQIGELRDDWMKNHGQLAEMEIPPEDWLNNELARLKKPWRIKRKEGTAYEVYEYSPEVAPPPEKNKPGPS